MQSNNAQSQKTNRTMLVTVRMDSMFPGRKNAKYGFMVSTIWLELALLALRIHSVSFHTDILFPTPGSVNG